MKRLPVTKLGLLALFSASVVFAQGDNGPDGATMKETEAGIPVADPLVKEKCGACHTGDDKGNLSRISWVRTTPEGWAQAIKRMVRLNGLSITPEESRAVVKSLASSHGLAPEEARPVMYLPEKRIIDEALPNETMRGACASCHAYAQPLSWRRSKLEWKTLQDLHVALYSQADAQYRRPAEDSEQPAGRDPKDKLTRGDYALTYLPKVAGLHTPEWAAWSARQRNPRLAGEWLVVASVPGKGKFVGEFTVAPGKAADEFTTSATLRSLADGGTISRAGAGIVYAGYSWRGSSKGGAAAAKPDDLGSAARETMWFAPDQQSAQGRWFWGEYQEFGYDVKLVRATAAPAILAVTPGPVKAGTKGVQLRIFGHNLPASPAAADIDLGAGITVTKIVSASPKELVVIADVAPAAPSGQRDVALAGAVLEQAFPVYRNIDYIKATPETALARLGGIKFAKGYQQFEAIGYDNGLDGKPNTGDDVALGPIEADWAMQEFMTVSYDDDMKYVGALSPNAFFTPGEEGPNPARRFARNNYGEVWAVATAKSAKDKFGKALSARSYLVVTVPMYQRWDQPEVSR